MSDDLISRKAVIEIIRDIGEMLKIPCGNGGWGDSDADNSGANSIRDNFAEKVIDFLSAVPTAYDVDKVVERLEEKIKALGGPSSTDEAQDVAVKEIMWCTDVVKGGGVDE
ncbi:hypothetical protein [Kineothrix sedimenti]|uniref:Uncharacterized protein n=1 Tax=Kineothrix sedimenti TaxID=3123317 RepID=A0ABZ3ESH6_9FIRM